MRGLDALPVSCDLDVGVLGPQLLGRPVDVPRRLAFLVHRDARGLFVAWWRQRRSPGVLGGAQLCRRLYRLYRHCKVGSAAPQPLIPLCVNYTLPVFYFRGGRFGAAFFWFWSCVVFMNRIGSTVVSGHVALCDSATTAGLLEVSTGRRPVM
jgi:hypothetical protein